MRTKYFEHKVRRAWWAAHLEAWRRSGVTRTEYCRLHRLNKSTFDRWLAALNLLESAREEARKRRKRTREPVSTDKRNKAVQAFWAMHIDYAAAHHISVYSLRTWRARLDAAPLQVDWRARLHPSALPTVSASATEPSTLAHGVSSGRSSAAKETSLKNSLTDATGVDPARDGRSNRRRFTDAEKLAIVMEAEQPGVRAAAVCHWDRSVVGKQMIGCEDVGAKLPVQRVEPPAGATNPAGQRRCRRSMRRLPRRRRPHVFFGCHEVVKCVVFVEPAAIRKRAE